jgi:RNA polymerase sigma factor (sigma-70 family)
MTDHLPAELLVLREQLNAVATSAEVRAAWQLTTDVMPVLEPVWNVLVGQDNGVGFLRRLGSCNEPAVNTAVMSEMTRTFQSLELVAPGKGTVWQTLSRPSVALVSSIRQPLRLRRLTGDRQILATLGATVRPALPGLLLDEWRDEAEVVPTLRRVLCMWCDLARNSTGERREVARLTLAAAMLARGAVLDGDTATVKWFVKRWLGLAASDSRVDGASAALLENGWSRRTVDDEFSAVRDSVTDLRVEALYQHRVHRPVWETQLRGTPVALLGDAAPESQTTDDDLPETLVTQTILADTVQSVLATLSEREAGVARLLIMEGRPLAEASYVYGISSYRVRRIRDKVIQKLQHESRSTALRDFT